MIGTVLLTAAKPGLEVSGDHCLFLIFDVLFSFVSFGRRSKVSTVPTGSS